MWHEFNSNHEYIQAMVRDISAALRQSIAATDRAGLAVSGGRSPVPLFAALSATALPWAKVHITLVDERYVAPDHPDSNEHLVRTHLLKNLAAAATFTGLAGSGQHLDDCRSEEHTCELQSIMRISYAVFCLKKIKNTNDKTSNHLRHSRQTRT